MVILYALSLGSELICNDKPLYVYFEGSYYFPVFRYYPAQTFLKNGENTRTDYHALRTNERFLANADNYMLFPLFEYGPYLSVNPVELEVEQGVDVALLRQSLVFAVNVTADNRIAVSSGLGQTVNTDERSLQGLELTGIMPLPQEVTEGLAMRFANKNAPMLDVAMPWHDTVLQVTLPAYAARNNPPKTVRLNFREVTTKGAYNLLLKFDYDGRFDESANKRTVEAFWYDLPLTTQTKLLALVKQRLAGVTDAIEFDVDGVRYKAESRKLQVRFPFPPTIKHPFGLDNAGRDVLARILYGLRTSMTFGLLLVIVTMGLGVMAGAVQGYYGGKIDLAGQRFTEIWAALPFLYVMILLGSIYGRGFVLLLVCYGLFNWVGISYYMRAEFLRLRTQTFVEAAKCMGLPARKVIFRHILPNALVPILTFFPFQLVGAIGALAALDYLGFGLPPPTSSWGELLSQAQAFRWAWWLILYPGLALFIIMLLGVFVGDGLRNAYDPKRYTWLE